jgi:hypothetical protein
VGNLVGIAIGIAIGTAVAIAIDLPNEMIIGLMAGLLIVEARSIVRAIRGYEQKRWFQRSCSLIGYALVAASIPLEPAHVIQMSIFLFGPITDLSLALLVLFALFSLLIPTLLVLIGFALIIVGWVAEMVNDRRHGGVEEIEQHSRSSIGNDGAIA